jgi:hypothetical protein
MYLNGKVYSYACSMYAHDMYDRGYLMKHNVFYYHVIRIYYSVCRLHIVQLFDFVCALIIILKWKMIHTPRYVITRVYITTPFYKRSCFFVCVIVYVYY